MITFSVIQQDECTLLQIGGELSIYSAQTFFNEHIKPFKADTNIMLDLGGVEDLDTAGVQILLMLMNTIAAAGFDYKVRRISEPVASYLALFKLGEKFSLDLY